MSKKSLYKEALDDVKLLKKTAMESAQNTLLEAFSPKIRESVDAALGEDLALEMPMYEAEDEEEPVDAMADEELPEEGMTFEAKDEDEDEDEEVCEAKDEDEEEDTMEETINVNEEDLHAALAEMLKLEADVSKGFADVTDPNDEPGPGDRGLEDKEKDRAWNEEEPPAAEDWTVKEGAYRKAIVKLQKENAEYKKTVRKLYEAVKEVNLFNSKLIHTTKAMQLAEGLSKKERISIVESFDRAETMREVELVYKSLSEALKIAGVLKEGRRAGKSAKASRYVPKSSTVLKEQMERSDPVVDRQALLAGIVK